MNLEEIDESEIIDRFPTFCFPGKRYFYIIDDNNNDIGLYGLKPKFDYKDGCVEISLYIFKENRFHKQYKKILIYLLNYPFFVNYKCILIHTEEKSVRTFLKACKKLNIISLNPEETWFYRGKL